MTTALWIKILNVLRTFDWSLTVHLDNNIQVTGFRRVNWTAVCMTLITGVKFAATFDPKHAVHPRGF
jgi:hypothetical protein